MKIGDCRLGFVGFGHMGQVILKAIDAARLIPRSQIRFHRRDSHKAKENEQAFGITSTTFETLIRESNVLFICVRPNQAEVVLQRIAQLKPESPLICSVMVGIKIAFIQKCLGLHMPIARAMPNIASEIGEGMTLLSFAPHLSNEWKSLSNLLFSPLGQVMEIPEYQMDIGSAIAGSGPAFVIQMIEAMANVGEKEGIAYAKSLQIAAQVFAGAAHLIREGALPRDLLTQIATPGGSTIVGLDLLSQTEVASRFQDAILASTARAKEISENFF